LPREKNPDSGPNHHYPDSTPARSEPPAAVPSLLSPPSAAIGLPPSGPKPSAFFLLYALLGWFLVSFFFLGLQSFHPIFASSPMAPPGLVHQLIPKFWMGFGLLILGFAFLPSTASVGDIGRKTSRFLLLMILILAAFMRLYDAGSPPGHYWQDFQLALIDACLISDYNRFFIYAPLQGNEPLYAYVMAFFLRFFPSLDGIFVQRLVLALFDLAAIWVFYLAGKEFGKRRIGLLAASFAAISRPMIMMNLSYMRYGTVQLAIALVLLFSLRVFKKPNLPHFLQWGAAIGFGYYTYTAFQTFGFLMVLVMLFWTLFLDKGKQLDFWGRLLGWGLMAYLILLFLFTHRAAFKQESLIRSLVFALTDKRFIFLVMLALVWALYQNVRAVLRGTSGKSMLYYTLGFILALALVFPVFQAGIGTWLGVPYFDETSSFSLMKKVGAFGNRILSTFYKLYQSGQDRGDISPLGDPFFGVTDLIFIFPGLVLIALKPSWPKFFVLSAALTGLIPHLLSDPGGNRLVGCTVPFLLLGALGFNHLMNAAAFVSRPVFWKSLLIMIWLGLLAFGGFTTFQKAFFYFNKMKTGQVCVSEQIRKDCVQNRVYGIYLEAGCVSIMDERFLSYLLQMDSNPIYLEPSEEIPDVVVLLQDLGLDPKILKTMEEQFPKAQWSKIQTNPGNPLDRPLYILRMFIPKSQIAEDPSKIIHVVRVPKIRWVRRLFGGYRIGRGTVWGEDRVENLTDPFPPQFRKFTPPPSARCELSFDAQTTGKYRFAVETNNMTDFWIDGKRVLRLRPDKKTRREVSAKLFQGLHSVFFATYSGGGFTLPQVSVCYPDSKEWKPL
jgi:hypothetical protein